MVPILENASIVTKRGKPESLYRQIDKVLRERIKSEALKAGDRLPSVSEMVKKWGITYQTVQAALQLLEEDGLIRIEAGRRKGPIVLGVNRKQRKRVISFLRWCGDSLAITLEEGIRSFVQERGDELVVTDARADHSHFLETIANPPKGVEGYLLLPYELPAYERAISEAIKRGINVVLMDRVLPSLINVVSSISADHFNGAYLATKHLLETHRCPVHFFGWTDCPSSFYERYMGWQAAMHDYNHYEYKDFIWKLPLSEADEDTTMQTAVSIEINNEAAISALRRHKQDKCCIFAVGDDYAQSIYFAAKELNMEIGKDVFVVGFGDKPFCRSYLVPLSSVSLPNKQIGYEAARLLWQCINGEQKRPIHRMLPVELKIRTSSIG